MWEIIAANSAPLNVTVNALILAVWTLYFQLLWTDRRRERRARILINRSAGKDIDANCVVTNMGREAVYLECVALTFQWNGSTETHSLTDMSNLTRKPEADPRRFWFQGPVSSGEYLDLGSFRSLLHDLAGGEAGAEDVGSFEVLVVATYGPDNIPIGARRVFRQREDDREALQAEPTHQITGWRERMRLRDLLRE